MKKKYINTFWGLILFLSVSFSSFASPLHPQADKQDWPKHLRLLTGPKGGQWFMLGEPITEVLSTILPSTSRIGGGLDNITAINSKTGDIGFSITSLVGASYSNEAEYQSLATDNITILANIYPQVFYVLLRKDFAVKHNIHNLQTLLNTKKHLRFASLRPGTASEFILQLVLKHGYGTNLDTLRTQGWEVSFNNYAETADKFVAGEIDCFAYTAGTTVPLIRTIESHTEVMILPLEDRVLQILADKFKTHTYIIQPGQYKATQTPIHTLGDYTCIIVRKDLPASLIYKISEALWKNKYKIAESITDFGSLSVSTAVPKNLPTHPGAIQFWTSLQQQP